MSRCLHAQHLLATSYRRRPLNLCPSETRGALILDVPLPGLDPWNEIKGEPVLWHFGFHQTRNLPEQLIEGREFLYFRDFFDRLALNRNAISDADVEHYVKAYAGRELLRAGLGFYRSAYPASEKFNAAETARLSAPIVLAGRSGRRIRPWRRLCASMGVRM
ncbi:MAG TPA: hypothetical protein VHK24_12985 [Steroidobacter sp.]|nr:hypothetical protein [Steroidobacter sp.]